MRTFVAGALLVAVIAYFVGPTVSATIFPVTPYEADVNKDGRVNSIDLANVARQFGNSAPLPTAVPSATPTPPSYCRLSGRSFHNAQLGGNNFNGCTFAGATFDGNSSFSYGSFSSSDFSNVTFEAGTFLVHANFASSVLRGARLENEFAAEFNAPSADFTGADMSNNTAAYCPDYSSANTCSSGLIRANFTSANLTGANLTNVSAYRGSFVGANLTNATLSSGQTGLVDARDAFNGADFTGAVTTGANVSGVIWNNTTCPDGTNSDNDGGSCVGHGFAGTALPTYTPTAISTQTDTPTVTSTATPAATATATPELVSVNSSGVSGNNGSNQPSISADGRFVAFQSAATNLVADDTKGLRTSSSATARQASPNV